MKRPPLPVPASGEAAFRAWKGAAAALAGRAASTTPSHTAGSSLARGPAFPAWAQSS